MPDFGSSFQQGLAAARAAIASRAEVKAVIDEFSNQLSSSSAGCAKFSIVTSKEPVGRKNGLLDSMAVAAFFTEYRYYEALAVLHLTSREFSPIEVARWRQSDAGYPCYVTIGTSELGCSDKEALEEALSRLAATTKFGEAVLAAMDRSSRETTVLVAAGPAAPVADTGNLPPDPPVVP
jgi:hypothetical protein